MLPERLNFAPGYASQPAAENGYDAAKFDAFHGQGVEGALAYYGFDSFDRNPIAYGGYPGSYGMVDFDELNNAKIDGSLMYLQEQPATQNLNMITDMSSLMKNVVPLRLDSKQPKPFPPTRDLAYLGLHNLISPNLPNPSLRC